MCGLALSSVDVLRSACIDSSWEGNSVADFKQMSASEARSFVLSEKKGSIEVRGLLDLRECKLDTLKTTIRCHDLDATGSQLSCLPNDLHVRSRLVLDDCLQLEALPENLHCGSISLRGCTFLRELPEGLNTWFLDLTNCSRFSSWPNAASIQRGTLRLRNCVEVQSLPNWLEQLAQLDLAGCVQLVDIPSSIQVSGWLDIGGTNIKQLPDSLANAPLRWRSVPIDHRIAFDPKSLTAKEILSERNAERRRVMIERLGYLEFAEKAGAQQLDADSDPGGERQLLRIELEDDEPLVGLACHCPSTQRQYFLRVPPDTKTCHQAAAWMAGFDDPSLYKPVAET